MRMVLVEQSRDRALVEVCQTLASGGLHCLT